MNKMGHSLDLHNVPSRLIDLIDWRDFACGYGAAVANISITYPINKVIFRQVLVN